MFDYTIHEQKASESTGEHLDELITFCNEHMENTDIDSKRLACIFNNTAFHLHNLEHSSWRILCTPFYKRALQSDPSMLCAWSGYLYILQRLGNEVETLASVASE